MQKDESKKTPRCWAIIPAAGSSKRMGTDVPKQYQTIHSITVIEASIACFLRHSKIEGIIVALHANDSRWSVLDISKHQTIQTVTGGATRAESVSLALKKLVRITSKDDFVLVHDAARPCLIDADLGYLIQQLINTEIGGILATPVVDTIKKVSQIKNSKMLIDKTLDRKNLWKALTPQMFRISILDQALDYCFENNINITDEASAVEAIGKEVRLVQGRADNIKITQQDDILLAEAIYKQHHS